MRKKIVFLMAYAKTYRLAFWNQLYEALARDGIDLRVVYCEPNSIHAERQDNTLLPAEYGRVVPAHWFGNKFVLHSAWNEIVDADLVITQNENKILLNPMLLALSAGHLKRVAFWGKGNIVPAHLWEFGEWLRYKTAPAVDWWFAYTDSTAANLRRNGVRCGITPVRNAIDTSDLKRDLEGISNDCLRMARHSIGMSAARWECIAAT
jgi:hypothetical protein